MCVVVIICKNLPGSPSLLGAVGGGGAERPHAAGGSVGGGNVGGGSVFAGGMSRRKSSSMDTIFSCERSAISAKELYYAPLKSDRETCMR